MAPVSYTYLDVYKRQHQGPADSGLGKADQQGGCENQSELPELDTKEPGYLYHACQYTRRLASISGKPIIILAWRPEPGREHSLWRL